VGPPVSHTVRTTAPSCRPCLDCSRRLVRAQLRRPLPPAVPPTVSAALGHRLVLPLKGAPLPVSCPFSSSAHCRHCAVMPPSLSRCEMPPRSPFELPVTALSSAPMSGAALTSLPAPSSAPLLHHHCSSPAEQSHHGHPAPAILRPSRPHPKHHTAEYILPDHSDPAGDPYSSLPPSLPRRRSPLSQRSLSVSSSHLFGCQTGSSPHRLAPRPLHRRPPVGFHRQLTGADGEEGLPCFVSG
jgi:hypothetical protein